MSFYSFAKGLMFFLLKLLYKIEVNGIENIPNKGKGIICSNHISLLDPIVVAIATPRKINFMAKKELFNNSLLRFLLNKLGAFPVDRKGTSLSAVKSSLKVLKQDSLLGIFPEGTRVRIENIENAKPGISMISIKSKSPIIPIYIQTNYRIFSKITVHIGHPIEFSDYYREKLTTEDYKNLSKNVMKEIYSLKSNNQP
ncbi:lysophospholipid acyltransferase family protein [Caldisalinibacter kiritimatiensis]|uniref:1-acyl-sn-glycerol-3-phosphate acyltransferase n=1 Tax=Caldisalinibacter kiritimatiensis TaxID=1304284 RepID=R1CH69_9FIRM|nr:lysophospholipid acyltransferase family protein [Caldisalinibacter kiritimatiensis]EOD01640.1 1-acyl-sn-glycerol-3-phosphate acyltransferase [Caldisalinibacter kiritimatiensis]